MFTVCDKTTDVLTNFKQSYFVIKWLNSTLQHSPGPLLAYLVCLLAYLLVVAHQDPKDVFANPARNRLSQQFCWNAFFQWRTFIQLLLPILYCFLLSERHWVLWFQVHGCFNTTSWPNPRKGIHDAVITEWFCLNVASIEDCPIRVCVCCLSFLYFSRGERDFLSFYLTDHKLITEWMRDRQQGMTAVAQNRCSSPRGTSSSRTCSCIDCQSRAELWQSYSRGAFYRILLPLLGSLHSNCQEIVLSLQWGSDSGAEPLHQSLDTNHQSRLVQGLMCSYWAQCPQWLSQMDFFSCTPLFIRECIGLHTELYYVVPTLVDLPALSLLLAFYPLSNVIRLPRCLQYRQSR